MAGNKRRRTREGFRTTEDEPINVPPPTSISRPTFLSTFDRESHYPIFSNLCGCLSIAQIVSLTQTGKKLSGLYKYLLTTQCDVDKALRRCAHDLQVFRSQMARYNQLIGGPFALKYFDGYICSRKPLDLYIQQGSGPEILRMYLSNEAGFANVKVEELDEQHLIREVRIHPMIFVPGVLARSFAITGLDFRKKCL